MRGEIEGKTVLDLFAGSGSLGIEAISNGAKEATFIDLAKRAILAIKRNISSLKIEDVTMAKLANSLDIIRDFSVYKKQFDLVFLDPPYHGQDLIKALQMLGEYDILARSGYVIAFCYLKDDFIEESGNISLILKKKYGQTIVLIYKKQEIPQD